jgi:SAM-dependent methyltransferase
MSTLQVDPQAVKAEQRENWDALAAGWDSVMATFERSAAPVTDRLLGLGGVRPGLSVLDVGTGLGEPALTAARIVGRTGSVVGIDISPAMVEVARSRAAGVPNLRYFATDLESIDLPAHSFDVVLSRFSLMFAVDHVALFRSIARLLVPGGTLAAAVWGEPSAVPMMALGYAVLGERLQLPPPPPGLPGPFSMSDPRRLAEELTAAGFVNVSVAEFVVPFRLASAEEYVWFTKAVLPPRLRHLLRDRAGSEDDPETWQAVRVAAQRYGSNGGDLSLPSTALCFRAVAPAST